MKMETKNNHKKNGLIILIAFISLYLICIFPYFPDLKTSSGDLIVLSSAGRLSIAILFFAVLLWFTEALPFAVTGLFSMILLAVLRVNTFKEIVKVGFGNEIICFFIGVLIISAAITKSGLGNRLASLILHCVGTKTSRVILGFLVVGMLLSMWITDMAVAAILLPLGVSILRRENIKPLKSNFGRALMISCAWGPIIGGIGTPAGCGPNPLAIGFLRDLTGVNIDFIQWMAIGVPSAILLVPCAWIILLKVFPLEIKNLSISKSEIKKELEHHGSLSSNEKKTIAIFLLTVVLWLGAPLLREMTGGIINLSISQIALFSSLIFFFPFVSVLSWKDAQSEIDWGGIILVVSGLSLGMMLYKTGAARWLAWAMLGKIGEVSPLIRIFVIVLIVSLLKVAFSSNTVTGIIIIPIIIALAQDLGLNPWLLAAPAAITSSLAFILVTSTPTNVIPYSAGYFSIKDMAKAGIIMTVVGAVCVTIAIAVMGPITGVYKF